MPLSFVSALAGRGRADLRAADELVLGIDGDAATLLPDPHFAEKVGHGAGIDEFGLLPVNLARWPILHSDRNFHR